MSIGFIVLESLFKRSTYQLREDVTGQVLVVCWLLGVGCCVLVVGYWVLAVGRWLLGTGCWALVVGCWLLGAGCCLLGAGCWVLGAGCLVLGVGCNSWCVFNKTLSTARVLKSWFIQTEQYSTGSCKSSN